VRFVKSHPSRAFELAHQLLPVIEETVGGPAVLIEQLAIYLSALELTDFSWRTVASDGYVKRRFADPAVEVRGFRRSLVAEPRGRRVSEYHVIEQEIRADSERWREEQRWTLAKFFYRRGEKFAALFTRYALNYLVAQRATHPLAATLLARHRLTLGSRFPSPHGRWSRVTLPATPPEATHSDAEPPETFTAEQLNRQIRCAAAWPAYSARDQGSAPTCKPVDLFTSWPEMFRLPAGIAGRQPKEGSSFEIRRSDGFWAPYRHHVPWFRWRQAGFVLMTVVGSESSRQTVLLRERDLEQFTIGGPPVISPTGDHFFVISHGSEYGDVPFRFDVWELRGDDPIRVHSTELDAPLDLVVDPATTIWTGPTSLEWTVNKDNAVVTHTLALSDGGWQHRSSLTCMRVSVLAPNVAWTNFCWPRSNSGLPAWAGANDCW